MFPVSSTSHLKLETYSREIHWENDEPWWAIENLNLIEKRWSFVWLSFFRFRQSEKVHKKPFTISLFCFAGNTLKAHSWGDT